MSRHREHGVVLIAALVAMAVVSALAVTFARSSTRAVRASHDAIAHVQADALVRSAVATASVVLGELAAREAPDTLTSPPDTGAIAEAFDTPGTLHLVIEDEARRIPVDRPEFREALGRLMDALGLDPNLRDALDDWTDRDDVARSTGAERDWYRRQHPSLVPADGPLASVGELTLVRGFTTSTVEALAPFVTVYGERGVNPNTAPREVLRAMWGEARATALIDARRRGIVTCDDLDHCVTRSARHRVRAEASVDGRDRGAEAIVWAPPGIDPLVESWGVLP